MIVIYIYKRKFEWRPGQSRGHFAQVRFFFLFLKFPKCFIHHILIVLVLIFFIFFFILFLSHMKSSISFLCFLLYLFLSFTTRLVFSSLPCKPWNFFIFEGWLLGIAFVAVPHDHGCLWVTLLVVALSCNELFNILFATKSVGLIFSAYFRKCFLHELLT